MRFIFYNPHSISWYKPPVFFQLRRRRNSQKYTYLLDYFLKKQKEVFVYIDLHKLSPRRGIRKFLPPFTMFYAWAIFNRINPLHLKIIKEITEIKDDDIIFMFLYGNFTNQFGDISDARIKLNNLIGSSNAFKVVHLTHYMYHANIGSFNAYNAKIDLFVAENNLSRNSKFFQATFSWYKKDVYLLPFVPKDKFKRLKTFNERKNKAIATGSITFPMDDGVFLSFFGHSMLQPMRSKIYENRNNLYKYIESVISPINEKGGFDTEQKKYYSYDIGLLYNDYKMFVVPEEIADLPGIGFVEGMKCGSVYIGLRDPMYQDLGLIDKIHYIGYDGSLRDLIDKIKYYQFHENELEIIAEQGYRFITDKFTPEKVAGKFYQDLELLLEAKNKNLQRVASSFLVHEKSQDPK